jgi:site-specific DNA-methyltransferase (adenine-specific)
MEEQKIDESIIFEIDPMEVTVTDERPRQRKELGEIEKMVESIKTFGQLQPVVINRNNELIAGGRRLAACMLGGFKVRACYKDTVDSLLMQEMELEENVQRKALTPAEECIAIKTLVELKRTIYGTPVQGQSGGYTLDDAASVVGKTRGSIIEAIQIADMLAQFPNLSECKTKSEIKSAVKGLQRTVDNIAALSSYEEKIKKTDEFVLVNRDAKDHMKGVPDKSIDLLFTDPPFGINIDKMAMSIGGHTGGDITTTGIKYDDSPEYALSLYALLAVQSIRFCKDTAHAIIFCGPSHFWTVKNMFNEVGWICSERPVIWIKQGSGQNNNPDAWFSSSYEMMLFARRQDSKLVLFGRPDWIQCNIVTPTERLHQAEKPVPLVKELISRVCMPGSYVYDPFCGSASIGQAAFEMKMFYLGCELAMESYAAAVNRMGKLKEAW